MQPETFERYIDQNYPAFETATITLDHHGHVVHAQLRFKIQEEVD